MSNSKKSKVLNPAYQEKVAIAAEIREQIKPFLSDYIRVFTEPRENGLRSKFWGCEGPKDGNYKKLLNELKLHTKYPQYKIELQLNHTAPYGWGPQNSVCLFIYDR